MLTVFVSILVVVTAANLIAAAVGRPTHRSGVVPIAAIAAGALGAYGVWVTWNGWWRLAAPVLAVLVVVAIVRSLADQRVARAAT